MKNIWHYSGISLLFALSFVFMSSSIFSAEKDKPVKIHVSGKTTLDGKPFPEAELYLQTSEWVDHSPDILKLKKIGSSVKDGSFSLNLKKNPKQYFSVIAIKPGIAMGWVRIDEKTINESAQLRMSHLNSALSGIVKNNNGKPLQGVTVKISFMSIDSLPYENGSIYSGLIPGSVTKTDNNGRFFYNKLPFDTQFELRFEADGYSVLYHSGLKSSGDNQNFTLYPEGCIEGRVTYSDTGKPVKGITVLTDHEGGGRTDKNGYYKIPKLEEGVYPVFLLIDKPEFDGWAAEEKQFIGVDYGKTTKADFELKKGVLLTGKVTEKSSGNPAEGVNVSIHNKHTDFITNRYTVTDKNGFYKFQVLPGEFEIIAYGGQNKEYSNIYNSGENQIQTTVSITDTVKTVDFIINKKLSITGIVRYPDGRPAKKAEIGQLYYLNYLSTDNNGKFKYLFDKSSSGDKFLLTADISEEKLEGSTEIEAVDGGFCEIILHPYEYIAVKGKIVDSNKNPVPGVKVSLWRYTGMESVERDSAAVSDQNGTFMVEKLRKNRIYFLSVCDGQIRSDGTDTRKNEPPEPVEIVIPDSSQSIWGKVTDESGHPVSGAEVFVWFTNGHKQALTDSLGYYRFDGIYNNAVNVTIETIKYKRYSFKEIAMNSENNFVLPDKNRWLNGHVYDKDGKPLAGISVTTNLTPYYPYGNRVKTDTNGKFRLKGIDKDIIDLQVYSEQAPELFRQEFKGIKTNQEIILKTEK